MGWGTNLFSPLNPGGTACKQPWRSSLPPRKAVKREGGKEVIKREMIRRSEKEVKETGDKQQKGRERVRETSRKLTEVSL